MRLMDLSIMLKIMFRLTKNIYMYITISVMCGDSLDIVMFLCVTSARKVKDVNRIEVK